MLTHGNLLYQINLLGTVIQPTPRECTLSILPTWHSFGRTGEYLFLSQGCTQIYTNKRYLKKDFQFDHFVCLITIHTPIIVTKFTILGMLVKSSWSL